MDEKDLGHYYEDGMGNVWQMTGYASRPSAMFLNLKTQEKKWAIIGTSDIEGFTKLVPEEEKQGK